MDNIFYLEGEVKSTSPFFVAEFRKEVMALIDKVKTILSDERGTTFIESALWIALVVLVLARAAVALAGTMQFKFGQIEGVMAGIDVPTLTDWGGA